MTDPLFPTDSVGVRNGESFSADPSTDSQAREPSASIAGSEADELAERFRRYDDAGEAGGEETTS